MSAKPTYEQLMGQAGSLAFATDTGSANTYVCTFAPAITARAEGQVLRFKVKTANTGASTLNDGVSAAPLVGGAHIALQGGELIANGDAWVQWNSSVGAGSYILLLCTGAPEQVAPATQSQHAMQLGQAVGRLIGIQTFAASGPYTYTPTAGTTSVIVEQLGGGGAGGGAAAPGSSAVSAGAGGGAGAFSRSRLTSGFSGAALTVGAGGVPVSGATGGTGGASSFGALISCPGGTGGGTVTNTTGILGGGASAIATGGNLLNAMGGAGGFASILSLGSYVAGSGGSSYFGGGGRIVNPNIVPSAAVTSGSGGAGAAQNTSGTALLGGAGAPGIIIIYEYA